MTEEDGLGSSAEFKTTVVRGNAVQSGVSAVATEVPLTLVANDLEIATLACTPTQVREFVVGFLFTAGFIRAAADMLSFTCDEKTWTVWVELTVAPDPKMLFKRLYTSGCGKGVMYSNVVEIAARHAPVSDFRVRAASIHAAARWLQTASPLHKRTGGTHTAALSEKGDIPRLVCDDIGRHNAVDKVIGMALLSGVDLSATVLVNTGRVSSEIVHKAKRSGIPVLMSLGAPTHQAVLLSREMKLTLVGFARGSSFTIFSNPERIAHDNV